MLLLKVLVFRFLSKKNPQDDVSQFFKNTRKKMSLNKSPGFLSSDLFTNKNKTIIPKYIEWRKWSSLKKNYPPKEEQKFWKLQNREHLKQERDVNYFLQGTEHVHILSHTQEYQLRGNFLEVFQSRENFETVRSNENNTSGTKKKSTFLRKINFFSCLKQI